MLDFSRYLYKLQCHYFYWVGTALGRRYVRKHVLRKVSPPPLRLQGRMGKVPLTEVSSSNGRQPHRNETAHEEDDGCEALGDKGQMSGMVTFPSMLDNAMRCRHNRQTFLWEWVKRRGLAGASRISDAQSNAKNAFPSGFNSLSPGRYQECGGVQKGAYAGPTHFFTS